MVMKKFTIYLWNHFGTNIKKNYNLSETDDIVINGEKYKSKFNNEEFYLENDLISETNLNGLLLNILLNLDISSKRFLTNKVDRSVTGLIAQQQCRGPFHTPFILWISGIKYV